MAAAKAAGYRTDRVRWSATHRLILSHYPPIPLFDDIADPHDWELLAAAESLTNPRIYDDIGNLALVPPERRVSGAGASWVMAAFTHISPDRTSRFSDGSYGVYYAGDSLDTAVHEHGFHMARHLASTGEPEGWVSEVRELVGSIDYALIDLRGAGHADLLNPDSYGASQRFAKGQQAGGADGIVYPSVRHMGGHCIAAFWPDVVGLPVQADHYAYHWSGSTIDYVRRITGDGKVFALSP
jgi:hypothetical protein